MKKLFLHPVPGGSSPIQAWSFPAGSPEAEIVSTVAASAGFPVTRSGTEKNRCLIACDPKTGLSMSSLHPGYTNYTSQLSTWMVAQQTSYLAQ